MYHCFVEPSMMTESSVIITGGDVNHIKNVMRMKPGEDIYVSDGTGRNVLASIAEISDSGIRADIISDYSGDTELPVRIVLYQGLPKSDKMETVVQKAVELGADRIVPVETMRSIVKLDRKKAESRVARWQAIAESAAKQSQRGMIPEVGELISFKEALREITDSHEEEMTGVYSLIPYELSRESTVLSEVLHAASEGSLREVRIFIGPEGGFESSEIEAAIEAGVRPVTLGRRILRTETAGPALISALMLCMEAGIYKGQTDNNLSQEKRQNHI